MYDTLVTLKKGAGRTLKAGGMWVYDNEIESIAGDFENGDIDVYKRQPPCFRRTPLRRHGIPYPLPLSDKNRIRCTAGETRARWGNGWYGWR